MEVFKFCGSSKPLEDGANPFFCAGNVLYPHNKNNNKCFKFYEKCNLLKIEYWNKTLKIIY